MDRSLIKHLLLGAAAGAVVMTIVGFSTGWVVSAGAAAAQAKTAARAAHVAALAPICYSRARADPDYSAKLTAMKAETSSWKHDDHVEAAGWATFQGSDKPDAPVADACVKLLLADSV